MKAAVEVKQTTLKNFIALTKPGIVMGNLMAAGAGFACASVLTFNLGLFLVMMSGLGLVMASGCVFNNYIDRFADQKMNRTKNRALATGAIPTPVAITFGSILGVLGLMILSLGISLAVSALALFGFITYVIIYSFVKHLSPLATLLGSIAGAVPPLVGYIAVTASFDTTAALLFLILVTWQMPHFYAIACYRIHEYKAANIPVLPIARSFIRTLWSMIGYILAFIFISFVFIYHQGMNQLNYLALLFAGLAWLSLCLKGFTTDKVPFWGRQMFRFSLLIINIWFISIWIHFFSS